MGLYALLYLLMQNNKEYEMVEGYMSIKETAEKWGITPRRVQVLCASGRIDGAGKLGREWAIPVDAERPKDERITTGEYRNWRKKEQEKD